MHFGRRFGTKLGGVLLFRKRFSGAVAWSFQRRCLRPSGPWCFAVSQAPVKRSFWTCVSKAQKVTFDTAACGLELPMALLASLRAMVFSCFASACQELVLHMFYIPKAWAEGTVAAFWTSFRIGS